MDYRLIYEDKDGECRIISPDSKFRQVGESYESSFGRIYDKAMPDIIEFIACKEDKIPKDLTFRDAWKKGDKDEPIKINFQKCMVIHRKRLKEACERKMQMLQKELDALDHKKNVPLSLSLQRTILALSNLHEMNLTHCKTPHDIKYAIPKELWDVWPYYQPEYHD
jgi:hypothetical protein